MSRGNYKTLDQENIHVDSHAENDKGGSKNESEIGEKLNGGHREDLNGTALVDENGDKRTNTDFIHAC